jgi:hypothetical protein
LFLRARVGISGVLASESVRENVGGTFAPKEHVAGEDCGGGGGCGGGVHTGGCRHRRRPDDDIAGAGDGGCCDSCDKLSAGMVAVDAFLWDDDDIDDMVEEGKLKRCWCR